MASIPALKHKLQEEYVLQRQLLSNILTITSIKPHSQVQMTQNQQYLLAILFGLVVSAQAPAGSADTGSSHKSAPMPDAPWSEVIYTPRWVRDSFREDYGHLVQQLSGAHGVEVQQVFLDLAELHLSHMLVEEAASILTQVAPQTPAQRERQRALTSAAQVLAGIPVEGFAESPLNDTSRPDREFWTALNAVGEGDLVKIEQTLAGGFRGLSQQSPAIVQNLLPLFFEAAIELEMLDLANTASQLLEEGRANHSSSTLTYLQGRTSEVMGNDATALEYYLLAAEGFDQYAARARIALADMAIKNGSRGALLAARDVLKAGEGSWRGDNYELNTLLRFADVSVELGDSVGALLAYGKVMTRFRQSEEAKSAVRRAAKLLDEVYNAGSNGDVQISTWMEIHFLITPFYETVPDFVAFNELLADRAAELGGFVMAADEYRRTIQALGSVVPRLDAHKQETWLFDLRLKLARALLASGQLEEALEEANAMHGELSKVDRTLLAELKADIHAARQDHELLLTTHVDEPKSRHLREIGRALMLEERWTDALVFYLRLRNEFSDEFLAQDASYLVIAAHRSDRKDIVEDVVATFPELTQSKSWTDLVHKIDEKGVELFPLRQDPAEEQLNRLEKILDVIKDSGL